MPDDTRARHKAVNLPSVYYLVHSPSLGPARFMHETELDAIEEARRIAKGQPGLKVYVLKAVYMVEQARSYEMDLRQDIPF